MLPEESLTEAERRLIEALPTGELVDLRECPPPERTIRAELLAEVLTGRRSLDGAEVRGARLAGAAVSGELDLEAATLRCPMLLWECSFDSPINLREARAMTVRMPGCSLAGIQADLLEVRGSLDLRRVVTLDAEIRLVAAHVSGQLHLDGAALAGPGGYALAADGLTIDQSVFCRQGFTATGEVCFVGSRVGGSIELDGAHLVNPDGPALNATGLTTAGDLSARDLVTEGTVRLAGAHIAGTLSLSGAQLSAPGEAVLLADGIRVDQDLFLRRGFTADGEVRLIGGHVTGTVDLGSACLVNRGGTALNAVSLAVEQEVFCGRGFRAEGEVVFSRARMSTLSFDGAHLSAPGGCALLARGLTVEQDLLGENGFGVEGELRLSGARIGGRLDFTGAKLENPSGVVLDLQGVHALELSLCLASVPQGLVDLTAAQVGAFHDDPVSWPSSLRLRDSPTRDLPTTRCSFGIDSIG
ncbi:hypothetical protein PV458_26990 [Streptomyces sp. MN03-5084-2B]|nr:hypothetical protein [Streptomyces sp. MN03-5084-2B]